MFKTGQIFLPHKQMFNMFKVLHLSTMLLTLIISMISCICLRQFDSSIPVQVI